MTTIPMHYVTARKGTDGRYRLFFTGTTNEVFPGMAWTTARDARMHAAVHNARNAR